MSILDNDNESPTVKDLKRQLDNLREYRAKVEGLCMKYLAQHLAEGEGMTVEEFSAQFDMLKGRAA